MPERIRVAVIMAGGSGERFWPLSRQNRPKQLLRLTSPDQSLLEHSIARVAPLFERERIYVATSRLLQPIIRDSSVAAPSENVLGEPCKRNTAGALAWAAANLLAQYGETGVTMAVLTADHIIQGEEKFLAAIKRALLAAEQDDALVTIGVVPTRPETGYGYIEIGRDEEIPAGAANGPQVYPVRRFREKPEPEAAEAFVKSGRFFWNSGMFFWTLETFLREIDAASPAHGRAIRKMAEALKAGKPQDADEIFQSLDDISIDYALMEKTHNVRVVRAEFGWDDVGSLDAFERSRPADANGNVTEGDPVLIDTRNSIVINEAGADKMAVAAVGVSDLAVIVTSDGVLVIPKNRAQDVKLAVGQLKAREANQL